PPADDRCLRRRGRVGPRPPGGGGVDGEHPPRAAVRRRRHRAVVGSGGRGGLSPGGLGPGGERGADRRWCPAARARGPRGAAGRSQEDRLTPESLVDGGRWSLAGRSLAVRTPAEEHPRPDTSASRSAGDLTHLLPSRVSYSQLDTLIACPHRWVLEHALRIR